MGRLTILKPRIAEADPRRKGPTVGVSQVDKNRLYGHQWRKARLGFLAKHPLCECDECQAGAKRVMEATVVDHRIPHGGDLTLFWDRKNWTAMSKPCHDRKTALRDGGFGAPRNR